MNLKRFIFDSLKTKFEGISDKVLNRIAAKLAKTAKTEEEATTAVEELTLQQVIDSYSDSRVTEAQEKAIGSYEKKHGLKDGKRIKPEDADDADMDDLGEGDDDNDVVVNAPKGGKGNGKGDETQTLLKALIKSNQAMMKEIASIKGEKIADTRKSRLTDLLKDAPEKLKNRYEKDFSRMNFETDDDFEEWLEDITPDIEDISSSIVAKEGVVGKPKSGGKTQEEVKPNPLVQARVEARKAETAPPAIVGLQTN